jgi:hypothetical protein
LFHLSVELVSSSELKDNCEWKVWKAVEGNICDLVKLHLKLVQIFKAISCFTDYLNIISLLNWLCSSQLKDNCKREGSERKHVVM